MVSSDLHVTQNVVKVCGQVWEAGNRADAGKLDQVGVDAVDGFKNRVN